jgi:hypothetical protein
MMAPHVHAISPIPSMETLIQCSGFQQFSPLRVVIIDEHCFSDLASTGIDNMSHDLNSWFRLQSFLCGRF